MGIKWNSSIKLILADVDETVADVYTDAEPGMIDCLNKILSKGATLFLISGGGLQSIRERITDKVNPLLRKKVLIAHCMGAEVWGFDEKGDLNKDPYYGVYNSQFSEAQKKDWRGVIDQIIQKFNLKTFKTMPKSQFMELTDSDPLSVMLADRGPQITLEFVNSCNLTVDQKTKIESDLNIFIPSHEGTYDLRTPVIEELKRLYSDLKLPVTPRMSGTFALDNTISGVDKTMAIRFVLENKNLLHKLNLPENIEFLPDQVEIWGDKYSQKKGGPDFFMCKAVDPATRAIDFREEDPEELPKGYNIQIWRGNHHLHEGLLEYLQMSI